MQNQNTFVDIEEQARAEPVLSEDGTVEHPLYLGAPRLPQYNNRFDRVVVYMNFGCILCKLNGTPRSPFRSASGITEHFKTYHALKILPKIVHGKVGQGNTGDRTRQLLAARVLPGSRRESLVDRRCDRCSDLITAASVYFEAKAEDGTRAENCVKCAPRNAEFLEMARAEQERNAALPAATTPSS